MFHYFGIITLLFCTILIGSAGDESKKETFTIFGNEVSKVSPVTAVLVAITCPVIFSISSLIMRAVHMKLRIGAMDFRLGSNFIMGLVMVV
jgi:hypothetical protein